MYMELIVKYGYEIGIKNALKENLTCFVGNCQNSTSWAAEFFCGSRWNAVNLDCNCKSFRYDFSLKIFSWHCFFGLVSLVVQTVSFAVRFHECQLAWLIPSELDVYCFFISNKTRALPSLEQVYRKSTDDAFVPRKNGLPRLCLWMIVCIFFSFQQPGGSCFRCRRCRWLVLYVTSTIIPCFTYFFVCWKLLFLRFFFGRNSNNRKIFVTFAVTAQS